MIYAGDTYTPLPTKELYNTQMMMASIAAAKDMYEKTEKQLDEFFKTYNDFRSPVQGAQEEYARLTTNRVDDALNQLYQQGIDPLRNAQGRAAIQNIIRSTDYGRINKLKQQAENYNKYLDAKREMIAKGLTTDDFENWMLKQQGLGGFTAVDERGQIRDWTRLTPEQYTTLDAATTPWFAGIDDTFLGTDGNWDIVGVGRQQLENATSRNLYDYLSTKSGRYNYENFAKNLGLINDNMSQEQIDQILSSNPKLATSDPNTTVSLQDAFKDEIINRHLQLLHEKRTLNPLKEKEVDYQYQVRLDDHRLANDKKLDDYKTNNAIRQYNATHPDPSDKSKRNGDKMPVLRYSTAMWLSGLGNIVGLPADRVNITDLEKDGKYGLYNQQKNIVKSYKDKNDYVGLQRRLMIDNPAQSFMKWIGLPSDKKSFDYSVADRGLLKSPDQIVTQLAGYSGTARDVQGQSIDTWIKRATDGTVGTGSSKRKKKVTVHVSDRLLTGLFKDGRVHQYQKVVLQDEDGNTKTTYYDTSMRSQAKKTGQYMANTGADRSQPLALDIQNPQTIADRDARHMDLYKPTSVYNNAALQYDDEEY